MSAFPQGAVAACFAVLAALPPAAAAAQQSTFTGAWAPTADVGFSLDSMGAGSDWMQWVVVSPDGRTLTATLDNEVAGSFESFFLENYYGYNDLTRKVLPVGRISYDYSITYTTAGALGVRTFDDFGNDTLVNSGATLSGHRSTGYTGGYFGYLGVNIRGLDSDGGAVAARATVVLSNFSAPAPVPEPDAWLLALAGLGVLALRRRG